MDIIYSYTNVSQALSSIGRYLYKNLAGSYKSQKASNEYNVWTVVMYQIPSDIIKKYRLQNVKEADVQEAKICVSLAAYDKTLRVNLYEIQSEDIVLGHMTIKLEKYLNQDNNAMFEYIKNKIESYMYERIQKVYKDYEFIF